jgi:hypothetical protein
MRVSSLSDERIIKLITRYFVPAWLSHDDYQLSPRSREEQTELQRIERERHDRGLPGGTVCVFILDADGSVLASQPVQLAMKPENLLPLLEKIVAEKKLTPRRPEAIRAGAARPTEVRPKTEGGRLVHVWTRCDQTDTNGGLSHDRVELTATECKEFLPKSDARPRASWRIPDEISHRLFQYCYPPNPHWKASDCKLRSGTLKATLDTLSAEEACVALEGDFELSFPYTGKPTDGRVTARLVGMAKGDAKRGMFTSLALVSERADYVWYWQGKPQPIKVRIAIELEP